MLYALLLILGISLGWLLQWLLDRRFWAKMNTNDKQAEQALTLQLEVFERKQEKLQQALESAQLDNSRLLARLDTAELHAREMEQTQQLRQQLHAAQADLQANVQLDAKANTANDALVVTLADTLTDIQLQIQEQAERQNQQQTQEQGESNTVDVTVDLDSLHQDVVATVATAMANELARQPAIVPNVAVTPLPAQMNLLAEDGSGSLVRRPKNDGDLQVIKGIGPKIAELLRASPLSTFASIAAASGDEISAVLAEAGKRFRLADTSTWPEQASYIVAEDWVALDQLQVRIN